MVRDERAFDGEIGELVSLLALGGPARGVRTRGLRWELDGHDLPVASGWGMSNELTEDRASVALDAGVVLVVRPGEAVDVRR